MQLPIYNIVSRGNPYNSKIIKIKKWIDRFENMKLELEEIAVDLFLIIKKKEKKRLNEKLLKAVYSGELLAVKKLLKAGADINCTDLWNKTPLMWAAWNGHTDIVKILEKAGAK